MLIAQITDTHVGTGERARANAGRLEAVVTRVAALAPDLVLITGDLTEDGTAEEYALLHNLLAPLDDRLLLTLGNHDRRAAFFAAFPHAPAWQGLAQYAVTCGALRVVMLDTLDEGWETACWSDESAAWLDACLAEAPGQPTLIGLHHPPAETGVAWIDVNADGRWARRLARVVERHRQVIGLVAGHVHRPVATSFAGRPLIVAPSSAYPVAYDPRPIDPAKPDGRPLIAAGPPGFAMHEWTGTRLTTWFGTAADDPVAARFDESTQAMVAGLAGEAETHNR